MVMTMMMRKMMRPDQRDKRSIVVRARVFRGNAFRVFFLSLFLSCRSVDCLSSIIGCSTTN